MASARMIEVKIVATDDIKEKKTEPKNDIDSSIKSESLFDNVLANQVFQNVKNDLSEMVLYGVNRHLTLTDNYVAERHLKTGVNAINRVISMGSKVLAGASIGGPIGAAIGLAFSFAEMSFDIIKNYDQQNIYLAQMDAQLEYQRQRVGYSLTSGSIGENR